MKRERIVTTSERAMLRHLALRDATLDHVELGGADLSDACFQNVSLVGTDLSGANLARAIFTRCDLRGADFSGANLEGASFAGSLVTGAHGLTQPQWDHMRKAGAFFF